MSSVASLFVTLLLALPIAATPMVVRAPAVTLPLAKRIDTSGGAINLVKQDQARAAALMERAAAIQSGKLDRRADSTPSTNQAVSYVATVAVGGPSANYDLIVDTGSSNTWVGAGKQYETTSTSKNTFDIVNVVYGSGFFYGTEWTDNVAFGPNLTILDQSIGVAAVSFGFNGVDGILGLGPETLTQGSLLTNPSALIPTVTQNLHSQGRIAEEVLGVFFEPTDDISTTNGELTFGGADDAKYTGVISWTPLTATAPARYYWGIDQSITYGNTVILSKTAGIVDTGTTLILLVHSAFLAYQSATGASLDSNTQLLKITRNQYASLQNLNFNVGSDTYALTPNGQIWPRALNTYIGGTSDPDSIYLITNDLGVLAKGGLQFINGLTFLERFYSAYDTTNQRLGFATTSYTNATIN